jgi:hypothetical protein
MQIRWLSDRGAAMLAAREAVILTARNSQTTHACPPYVPRRTAAVINSSPAHPKSQMASSPTVACSA